MAIGKNREGSPGTDFWLWMGIVGGWAFQRRFECVPGNGFLAVPVALAVPVVLAAGSVRSRERIFGGAGGFGCAGGFGGAGGFGCAGFFCADVLALPREFRVDRIWGGSKSVPNFGSIFFLRIF